VDPRKAITELERAARQADVEGRESDAYRYRAAIARIHEKLADLLKRKLQQAA
jgi:hypothetical protein